MIGFAPRPPANWVWSWFPLSIDLHLSFPIQQPSMIAMQPGHGSNKQRCNSRLTRPVWPSVGKVLEVGLPRVWSSESMMLGASSPLRSGSSVPCLMTARQPELSSMRSSTKFGIIVSIGSAGVPFWEPSLEWRRSLSMPCQLVATISVVSRRHGLGSETLSCSSMRIEPMLIG